MPKSDKVKNICNEEYVSELCNKHGRIWRVCEENIIHPTTKKICILIGTINDKAKLWIEVGKEFSLFKRLMNN
jgi:hypothetical protein